MVKHNPGKVGGRRVAIVAGLRTPFVKSGTTYRDLSTLDLATADPSGYGFATAPDL